LSLAVDIQQTVGDEGFIVELGANHTLLKPNFNLMQNETKYSTPRKKGAERQAKISKIYVMA
jgi:hypothetical protein